MPGKEAELKDVLREFENERIPGEVSEYVYRMEEDSNEYYLAVVPRTRSSTWPMPIAPSRTPAIGSCALCWRTIRSGTMADRAVHELGSRAESVNRSRHSRP
jgi:hypothetical protein